MGIGVKERGRVNESMLAGVDAGVDPSPSPSLLGRANRSILAGTVELRGEVSSFTDARDRSGETDQLVEIPMLVTGPSGCPSDSVAGGPCGSAELAHCFLCCADCDAAAASRVPALLTSLSRRCASPRLRTMMPVVTSPVCAMNELGTTSSTCSSAHTSSRNASVHSRKHETERT